MKSMSVCSPWVQMRNMSSMYRFQISGLRFCGVLLSSFCSRSAINMFA